MSDPAQEGRRAAPDRRRRGAASKTRKARTPGQRPTRTRRATGESWIGRELELDVGPVAHGGHCVARHEGRVVFVRHTLPGETVLARVTEGDAGSRFLRADAVRVHRAAPERVDPACPHARPGGCGGCDWQHVSVEGSRALKTAVVREQLSRLAGLDHPVEVEPVPGDVAGLRWRTRVELAVDRQGRPGLRPHRSRDVLPIRDCPIAREEVIGSAVLERTWPHARAVDVVEASGQDDVAVVVVPRGAEPDPDHVDRPVRERVEARTLTREFTVAARGFWQVHPGAATTFVDAVLESLRPASGERALDLYAGVGLFAAALGEAVGPTGTVHAVEADATACGHARDNLADLPQVRVHAAPVEAWLPSPAGGGAPDTPEEGEDGVQDLAGVDLVVLDPPRVGAGREVIERVSALGPRALAYVACDPAALARDLAHAAAASRPYRLESLRAFDAFPMTHHVECVAVLVPV